MRELAKEFLGDRISRRAFIRKSSAAGFSLASSLDAKLPKRPFAIWFNDLVGPKTEVIWQLAECGEPISVSGGAGQDLPACAEAIVVLPNGVKVSVAISVGTFKKGIIGQPAFLAAVVESGEQLYRVRRLRDLPEILRAPENLPRILPDIETDLPPVKLRPYLAYLSPPTLGFDSVPGHLAEGETPPTPPTPPQGLQKPQKVSESVLKGSVITRVKPVYPASARSMNAFGTVEVRIIISEAGRVIEATVISGHPALHNAVLEAARKWVYKPTMLNGVAVKVESVLTFTFTSGAR